MNLKSIKIELFYIRRLLQEGYGPKYWWPYFKNRFFGDYLISRIPGFNYAVDFGFELHTICCKKDIPMLIWMLHSFLFHSNLRPKVIIHDDGSLGCESVKIISGHLGNNFEILFKHETTDKVLAMNDLPDIVKKARREGHFFLDRLIDIFVLSKAKRIMIIDTDILFYKPPVEVMDFLAGRTEYDGMVHRQPSDQIIFDLGVDEYFTNKYKTADSRVAIMNGGLILFDGTTCAKDKLVEYLSHATRTFDNYFIEMAGWACILAQMNFKFLSHDRYAIKGFFNDKMVMKHYSSPRRYEMFAYGIDKARKKMAEK